tara:strand:+ start:5794 stop:5910 length:117 start_codon:yes stop_codon:yes gene_type:complete
MAYGKIKTKKVRVSKPKKKKVARKVKKKSVKSGYKVKY